MGQEQQPHSTFKQSQSIGLLTTRNWTRARTGLLLKKWHTNNKMQYIIGNGEKITDDNSE